MTEFTPPGNESNPDPSQSGAGYETTPSGGAINSDATSKMRTAVTQDAGSATDPGPGARRRMGKKSAWALGGVITVAILSVALSATARLSLSTGSTRITMAAAASSAAPRGSAAPDAGNSAPLVSESAKAQRAPSGSARPTVTRSGKPVRPLPASSGKAASPPPASAAGRAAVQVTPGSHPATATPARLAQATQGTPVIPATQGTPATPATQGTPVIPAIPAEPKSVSWWALNDDDAESIAQDADGANPALGANIVWCGAGGGSGNCSTFNGTSSAFTTSEPVLNTGPGGSFTVSANVFMTGYNTADDSFETIASQNGAVNSGFYLQYSGADKRWAFARVVSDTDGAAGIRALSTSAPVLDTWTHLAGVFDASDDQLRLYVNGVLEGTATDTTPFAATGPLVIGRGQFDGEPTDWFNGAANQIQVWNVALTSAQVVNIPE
jgi:Concanavalin A-like lectin/glucanases superfamily